MPASTDWRDLGHKSMACNDYKHAIMAYANAGETKFLYNLGDFLLIKKNDAVLAKAAYMAAYYITLKSEPDNKLQDRLECILDEDWKVKNNSRNPITLSRIDAEIAAIIKILDARDGIQTEAS